MKKYLFPASLFTVFITISVVLTFGQQTEAERIRQEQKLARDRRISEQEAQRRREGVNQRKSLEDWNREMNTRKHRTSEYKPLSKKEMAEIKASLAPNPVDTAKYKIFLEQPNTGLFRLMPNLGCSSTYVVRADENCLNSAYMGEFYSFRLKDYSGEDFFDITYKDGNLISRGYLSQGILTTLGNISLEDVSLVSSGVKFLADFKPETDGKKVKNQFREIAAGIKSDDYLYAKSAQALLDTTYALRVIAYRPDNRRRSISGELTAEDIKFMSSGVDKRLDLTLVFRIIRKDKDGSLTILWKELSSSKAPRIVYTKDEKLTDISR